MNGKSVLETLSSLDLIFIGTLFGLAITGVFSTLSLIYIYVSRLQKQDDWLKELQSWRDQEDRKDYSHGRPR